MQRILLVMTSRTYRAQAFLNAANNMGVKVTTAGDNRDIFSAQKPQSHIQIDFGDPEAAVDSIQAFHRDFPLSAILSAEDEGIEVAAMASSALGLQHSNVASVNTARDKYAMRSSIRDAGLLSPCYWRFELNHDPKIYIDKVEYPCVLKPLFLSGSRGVIRANDPKEFMDAFSRIKTLLSSPAVRAQGGRMAKYLLVEVFIPGIEVALEGILVAGKLSCLAIFDKPDPLEGPYFQETIYVTPSSHPQELQDELISTASLSAQALGITNGPVHVEMRINPEGVWVVEVAPRSIGGYCSSALKFDSGRTLEELILRQSIGMDIADDTQSKIASGVMMIPSNTKGILKEVQGVADAKNIKNIDQVIIEARPGQVIQTLPEANRYLGFIFATAENSDEVVASLKESYSYIKFIFHPET